MNDIANQNTSTPARAQDIAEHLRDEILLGQYRQGERLPSERDLAARFQVNRGAVREAIKILAQLGIVKVQPGGVRILGIHDASLDVLGPLLDLGARGPENLTSDLISVFGALLALSARLALQTASKAQAQRLLEILNESPSARDLTDDNNAAEREKLAQFAEALTDINNNLVLRLIGNGLRTQMVGRLERRHPSATSNEEFFRAMALTIQRSDPNGLAKTIIQRFDDIKRNLDATTIPTPTEFNRNPNHA
ncbi:MAG: GntR family transcriptional regulator [Pseudomonadales bacterium]|nr:GntR family transcriptional regulator [Pseudomonadales bacterium]